MASLYDISSRYKNLIELIDNPEVPQEAIQVALDGVQDEFKNKADNIVMFMKNIDGDIEAIKAEETRLADRRKALTNRKEGLKNYLYQQMKITNMPKFKTALFSYGIQKNPSSVEVVDESKLDKKYLIEQPSKVDKKMLLTDLKEGLSIEGAKIVQGEGLRIR